MKDTTQIQERIEAMEAELTLLRCELSGGAYTQAPCFGTEEIVLLVCRLDKSWYAFPLDKTNECLRMVALDHFPDAPRIIAGMMNLRGMVVPVLDVRHRFGHPPREMDIDMNIVVISHSQRTFGIVVDEIIELCRIQGTDVKAPREVGSYSRYIHGITRIDNRLILMPYMEALVSLCAPAFDELEQQGQGAEHGVPPPAL